MCILCDNDYMTIKVILILKVYVCLHSKLVLIQLTLIRELSLTFNAFNYFNVCCASINLIIMLQNFQPLALDAFPFNYGPFVFDHFDVLSAVGNRTLNLQAESGIIL